MSARSLVTWLSLASALAAFAPAISHAQDNDIVADILSQILSGG